MHIAPDTIVDGRYRVLKRLGTGGMAEVWCAEDEVLGRNVALKLLGSRYAEDPEFRERFRREARAAAGLTHPNIVGIFDRAEWDGTPYIAMELVDGRTLKELVIERGPMPVDVAIDLTEQLLKALGYAHKRGIVHRDVKPQNVIIDGEGQAKVADFGIARAVNSDMTETGAIVGTVQYLSPEQAHGPAGRPALRPLLGGRRALRAADRAACRSTARRRSRSRSSTCPSAPCRRRSCGPGIPPALESVVLRALEKDPAYRFQSAEEFITALENARRAPTRPIVHEPVPSSRERVALVDVAARRCSRSWRSASGAYFLLARQTGDGAERRRPRGERGGRHPARRGPRGRVRQRGVRRRPARRGDQGGSEARRGGARGHDDHADRLRRARHRRRSRPSRASRARRPSRR